jgi:fructose/tagatose bisphosphate aldolase
MIVTTADLYKLAYSRYAIGAYNINNLEQTLGLFKGCIDSRAPFIIQLSKGARKYADKGMLEVMIRRAEEIYPEAVLARGVDEDEYLPAAKLGVTKINIDTDGRLVWTRVHREFFRDHPEQFDFRPPGTTFVREYAKFIAHKNEKLGSAGKLAEVTQALEKKA